jgi:hypothetical protein
VKRLAVVALLAAVAASVRPAQAAGSVKDECIAANSEAQDLQHDRKFIEAHDKLILCIATTCPGPVREDCAERLKQVDGAMPSIVFDAKDANGNDLAAVRVTMDGQQFAEKLDGSAVHVDPGEHRFAFTADGLVPVEKTVVVKEGERDRHVSVVLESHVPVPAPAAESDGGSAQRTWGLIVGGVGVAGLVVGGVFGLTANSTYKNANCPNCAAVPQNAYDQATISTIAFIAGGALVAGGAVLFFTTPSGDRVALAPTFGPGVAGMSARGAW